ncbi:MAG: hypothetical protein GYA55_14380 [SAR324 cluster bacterium]|uniref:Hexokinase n=1 Tax=SAR324 cluster bacterium TaxID=2024889 RepID=A0A7X9IKQ4_9DELT|nr:hypothetical protein [SAR324 cluster bacterium]
MSEIGAILNSFLSYTNFLKLVDSAGLAAANAGNKNVRPTLACDPSFIPVTSKPDQENTIILGVDVGGTHVKCGLRSINNSKILWSELADISNDSLKDNSFQGTLMQRMTKELARRLVLKLEERNIPKVNVAGIGVVWSNQLVSSIIDPLSSEGTRGVTGVVSGKGEGTAYRKCEWWNEDLEDGHDIGTMFLEAFREAGLKPKSFVIGNDTIFTCKAINGADAGMVASTGANCTIIPSGKQILCNSESGGFFEIPSEYLANLCSPGHNIVKLEDAMAGVGLPGLFLEYIRIVASKNISSLKPIGAFLEELPASKRWNYFVGQDMSALLDGNIGLFLRGKDKSFDSIEAQNELTLIASEFARVGGAFAALMAYISIFNQLTEKDEFLIALDSSQSRFVRGYFESMQRTLTHILAAKGKKARIELLKPQGEIAVPMVGVVRAVNDFLL